MKSHATKGSILLASVALLLIPALAGARYLQVLPSEVEVQRALQSSPQIVAARVQIDIAAAQQKQLKAGNYEWTVGF
ncbi:MAG TPA: hypothetical protein VI653_13720, partial [Steroidobacteraceae bacterium]